MTLDEALRQFDIVEANLAKADAIWTKLRASIPGGILFVGQSREGRVYQDLVRDFLHVQSGLPAIDGWRVDAQPWDLDDLAQARIDAMDIGEPEAEINLERGIDLPGVQLDEYRSRLRRKRRELVRARLKELAAQVDGLLRAHGDATAAVERGESVKGPRWDAIETCIDEIDRLLGGERRGGAWNDLRRHLGFGQRCDLEDIAERDWPSIKEEISTLAYDAWEPLPVAVGDLGTLVNGLPRGAVSTSLKWTSLDAATFERLLYDLVSDASGYENPEWLMHTKAPDRGRDISAYRVRADSLGGVLRDRVVFQCKHWLSRSVTDTDISEALTKISHWEPPTIDVVVFATSGKFTADGVKWVETRNHAGQRPKIELWGDAHLERALAQRPHVVAAFGLR